MKPKVRWPRPLPHPLPLAGLQTSAPEATQHCLHPLQDLLWAASFYSRFFLSYVPFYGVPGALLLFVAVRYGQDGGSGEVTLQQQAALTTVLLGSVHPSPTLTHSSATALGCRRNQINMRGGRWGGQVGGSSLARR